jgi:uncharacterized protein YjbI with pentapeptide repeats
MQAMAEIAVACWHGNGRTTTVAEIEKYCQHSGISSVLEVFKTSGSQGVTQLLTAFYFRQQGVQGTDKTFEFTHKSFREYLTVRRIITEIEAIEDELKRHRQNPGRGWNEQECLRRWAVLCGAEAMDRYLFHWLCGEMQLQPVEQVAKWQQLFCDLISYMLRQGMPMEKLDGLTFLQMSQQSRNAEEALLAVLNACARVTEKISKIEWEKSESFGEWLSKLQGQRKNEDNTLAFECLSYLYLAHCELFWKDFLRINLQGANLQGANLQGANLQEANLEGANLQSANLYKVNLEGADLEKANLYEAHLEKANLIGANLERSKLVGANLVEADLEQARLTKANLKGADLQNAYLFRVDLTGANLENADLEDANLDLTDLQGANLIGANLIGVNIVDVSLRKEDLNGIKLHESYLPHLIFVDNDGNPLNENS